MATKQTARMQTFRRVVTGHGSNGEAIIVSDGPPDRVFDNLGEPGLVFHEVWNTREAPALITRSGGEPMEGKLTLAPPSGGTRIRVCDIPPERADTNHDRIFAEIGGAHAHSGASTVARHPNMHRTQSIDYGIVIEGELTLILDHSETILRPGDIVVQNGTNHGWANRSDRLCRVAFVLIDGTFEEGLE